MNCTNCKEELDTEEKESPRRDRRGNIICDRCYEEEYSHICPICEEKFDEDFSKEISPRHFLITEDAGDDLYLAPGIYKIISYPFFRDGIIETSLIESAILKIADLPEGICENDINYVCEECVERMLNERS